MKNWLEPILRFRLSLITHNSSEPAGAALLSQMPAELGVDKNRISR